MSLGAPVRATAAAVSPVSYSFDQPTSCGEFCYHDTTGHKLTDGVQGFAGWELDNAAPWVGWLSKPTVNIDFDFGAARSIGAVSFGSTQDSLVDVALPSLSVYSSSDGANWVLKGSLSVPPSDANNQNSMSTGPHVQLTVDGLNINDRYVRVQTAANGPWTFADEISFSSAAPEPAAWTLLILGVAGAGGALRLGRRRATV